MGVQLSGEAIRAVLANADQEARQRGDSLLQSDAPHLAFMREALSFLRDNSTPKSYLPITAVFLVARALFPEEELDVLATQVEDEERGYAAASIGLPLAAFAKEQGIDMRAKSSQPLNNQPFTYRGRLTRDTKVARRFTQAWQRFYSNALVIQELTQSQAKDCLALLFHVCRQAFVPSLAVQVRGQGRAALSEVAEALADYVSETSDNGKVGQAFAAALLDLVYGADNVVLGATQDPDASVPGDVQVSDSDGVWLWTEAKQKVVQTGDITGFLEKVKRVDGERVVYFALKNSGYSGYIRPDNVTREASVLGIEVQIIQSPREAIDLYVAVAPGSFTRLAGLLLERTRIRLVESGVSDETLSAFDAMASAHATLSVAAADTV